MNAEGLQYEIVPMDGRVAGARHFVFHSWTRDYRTSARARAIPRDAYYPWQRAVIEALLDDGARVWLARDIEHPGTLWGWICADRVGATVRVHYAYAKVAARYQGLFTALLERVLAELGEGATAVVYTHDPVKRLRDHERGEWVAERGFREKLDALGLTYAQLPAMPGRAA